MHCNIDLAAIVIYFGLALVHVWLVIKQGFNLWMHKFCLQLQCYEHNLPWYHKTLLKNVCGMIMVSTCTNFVARADK